jgi:hypothetical protein
LKLKNKSFLKIEVLENKTSEAKKVIDGAKEKKEAILTHHF